MTKARIVKRTHPSGRVEYVIHQRHFLFRWWWVDAWINSSLGAACKDSFLTLEQAKNNLWQFDGSRPIDQVTMKNRELQITVAGEPASGKSTVCFLLKKFLREHGFEVEFDGGVDFDSEQQFDQLIGDRHLDAKVERISETRKIVLTEAQLPRSIKQPSSNV